MVALSEIREIEIRVKETGAARATDVLRGLTAAEESVVAANERVERTNASVERSYLRLVSSIDTEARNAAALSRAVTDLNDARSRGIITAERHNALMALANQRFGQTANGARLAGHEITNLGAQFSDIAVSLAGGQSPMLVMMQQGAQIQGVLGDRGLKGGIAALGQGLMSFVTNPLNLAIVGFGVAATAAGFLFEKLAGGPSDVDKLDSALKAHEATVKSLAAAYGDLVKGVSGLPTSPLVARAALGADENLTRAALSSQAETAFSTFGGTLDTGPTGEIDVISHRYAALSGAIARFRETARAGAPDFRTLQIEIAKFYLANPGDSSVLKLYQDAMAALGPGAQLQAQLAAINDLKDKVRAGPTGYGLDSMLTLPRPQDTQAFGDAIAKGADALAKYRGETEAMKGSPLDQAIAREQNAFETLKKTLVGAGQQAEATRVHMERLAAIRAQYDSESGRKISTGPSDFERLTDRTQDRIRDLQSEIATFGMSKGAIAAYKLEQDLLAAAQDKGAKVTAVQREEISRLVRDVGAATDQLAKMKLAQDLAFEAAQAGRTRQDQAVYSRLQSAGQLTNGEISTPEARAAADSIRATQTYAAQAELVRELTFETQQLGRSENERAIYARLNSAGLLDSYGQIKDQVTANIAEQMRWNQTIAEAQQAVKGLGAEMIRGGLEGGASGALTAVADRLKNTMIDRAGQQIDNALMSGISNLMGGPSSALGSMFAPTANGSAAAPFYVIPLGGGLNPAAALLGAGSPAAGGLSALTGVPFAGQAANSNVAAAATALATGGGTWSTGGNYRAGVDPQLTSILQEAATRSGYQVQAFSGYRPGDPRYHGQGLATDVRLVDPKTGQAIPNYQNAAGFAAYEGYAQNAYAVASERGMADQLRWGGYFSGPAGKYGAMDTMHFDLAGRQTGMAGGSWQGGLTPAQRAMWPGANSIGLAQGGQPGVQAGAPAAAPQLNLAPVQQSFNQLQTSTQQAATAIPTLTQSATTAAPALGGLGQQATGLGGAFQSILGGIGQIGGGFLKMLGFDEGGYTGGGGRHQPAGLVHRGEVVWSQADVARAGGWQVVDAMRLGRGYSAPAAAQPAAAPASSAGNVNVRVINNGSGEARVEERDDGRGGRSIDVIIDEKVADANRRPGSSLSRSMKDTWGARPKMAKLG